MYETLVFPRKRKWIEASVGCTMKGTSRGSSLVRGKNDYNVDNCKRKAPALSRDFVYYLKEEKPTASPPL